MATLEKRLQTLEQAIKPRDTSLPNIVDDDLDDAEFNRLEALGLSPVRFTDALEMFL